MDKKRMKYQKPQGLLYGSIERAVYEAEFCNLFSKVYLNHKGYKTPLRDWFFLLFKERKQWVIKNCNKSFLIEYKHLDHNMHILNYYELNGLHNTTNTP